MNKLKNEYMQFFEKVVDAALGGIPQKVMFCENIVLELYLEDDMLHWRRVYGRDTSDETGASEHQGGVCSSQ